MKPNENHGNIDSLKLEHEEREQELLNEIDTISLQCRDLVEKNQN